MESPTQYFVSYERAIADAHLLVKGVPSEKSSTSLQHLKVQSFVLFAHAAMEEYLESISWAVAFDARKLLKETGTICFPLVSLVAAKLIADLPEKAKKKLSQELVANLDVFAEEALKRLKSAISQNHGVTEDNQKVLLLPIGIDPEAFDLVLMNSLHAFGGRRGSIAHSFTLIRNELTLGDVDQKVAVITAGLKKIDEAACALLQRHMPQ